MAMMDPDIFAVAIAISTVCFSIGGAVCLLRWSMWKFDRRIHRGDQMASRLGIGSSEERLKALDTYKALASEKLDVIKTAITMGYNQKELERLDARLEQLIGADALKKIVKGEAPLPSAELGRRDLEAELLELREAQ
jgi:hypothetical protein